MFNPPDLSLISGNRVCFSGFSFFSRLCAWYLEVLDPLPADSFCFCFQKTNYAPMWIWFINLNIFFKNHEVHLSVFAESIPLLLKSICQFSYFLLLFMLSSDGRRPVFNVNFYDGILKELFVFYFIKYYYYSLRLL